MKLLGFQLDDKVNFNLRISNICEYTADQLNALIILKKFMNFMANINYCPLVWLLSSVN